MPADDVDMGRSKHVAYARIPELGFLSLAWGSTMHFMNSSHGNTRRRQDISVAKSVAASKHAQGGTAEAVPSPPTTKYGAFGNLTMHHRGLQ